MGHPEDPARESGPDCRALSSVPPDGALPILMYFPCMACDGDEVSGFLTVAKHLVLRGHEVTLHDGPARSDCRVPSGARTLASLEAVDGGSFDLAHVHHALGVCEIRDRYPELPIVLTTGGGAPIPVLSSESDPGISLYLAISDAARDRLLVKGVPRDRVRVFLPMVDETRFARARPIRSRPQRAFILGVRIDETTERVIRAACAQDGFQCVVLGPRLEPLEETDLAVVFEEADLVFTSGRKVVEAMLLGRVPFLIGASECAGLVTPGRFPAFLSCGRSVREHRRRFDERQVVLEMESYRARDGGALRELAVRHFGAAARIGELEANYHEVLRGPPVESKNRTTRAVVRAVAEAVREATACAARWGLQDRSSREDEGARHDRRGALAEVLLEAGWVESARTVLTGVLEEHRDHPAALSLMARVGMMEGRLVEALAILRHVLAAEPDHPVAGRTMAELRPLLGVRDAHPSLARAMAEGLGADRFRSERLPRCATRRSCGGDSRRRHVSARGFTRPTPCGMRTSCVIPRAELACVLRVLGLGFESIDRQVERYRGGRNIPIRGVYREGGTVWADVLMAVNSVTLYAPGHDCVVAWQGAFPPEGFLANPRLRVHRQPDTCRMYGEAFGFAVEQTDDDDLILMNDDAVLVPDTVGVLSQDAGLLDGHPDGNRLGMLRAGRTSPLERRTCGRRTAAPFDRTACDTTRRTASYPRLACRRLPRWSAARRSTRSAADRADPPESPRSVS